MYKIVKEGRRNGEGSQKKPRKCKWDRKISTQSGKQNRNPIRTHLKKIQKENAKEFQKRKSRVNVKRRARAMQKVTITDCKEKGKNGATNRA